MRHGVKGARLGRPADQRKALIRGLVTEVLRHGKIKTTKVGGGPRRRDNRGRQAAVSCGGGLGLSRRQHGPAGCHAGHE